MYLFIPQQRKQKDEQERFQLENSFQIMRNLHSIHSHIELPVTDADKRRDGTETNCSLFCDSRKSMRRTLSRSVATRKSCFQFQVIFYELQYVFEMQSYSSRISGAFPESSFVSAYCD